MRSSWCALAGLCAAAALARLSFPGYTHGSVDLGGAARPVSIPRGGRQLIALSIKGIPPGRQVAARMEGAVISGWFPPVVRMPYFRPPASRLPIYVSFQDDATDRLLEILDAQTGSPLRLVDIVHGKCRHETH